MNKKLNRIIIALVIVVVALVALRKAGLLGEPKGIKVTTETAAERIIVETVNASGKVYPEVEVKVSSDISGEIVELNVQEGDRVRKGQMLARIYADLYTTERDRAQAVVSQQEAGLENSRAQLTGLAAARQQAKAAYERQKTLLAEKAISLSEFEQAESAYLSAEANYNAALQNIRSNEAAVASSKAALERADKDLGRTTLVAPMNGVVSLLAVKKGERVVGTAQMAGTEMMRIADMNTIEVQVDVSENDIPKVSIGDSATVQVDAYYNRKFEGVVTQIASSITTTSATNNDVANYKVHIRLLKSSYTDLLESAKPGGMPFRPGMSASADIRTNRVDNALSVPVYAVTTREKGAGEETNAAGANPVATDNGLGNEPDEVVFIRQQDNSVKKIVVKTGVQDLNYIQILSGLKGGEEVVTAPYATLRSTLADGMKVNVVPKDKLFETK